MTAEEAIELVRSEFERQNAGHFSDLSVTHYRTAFGAHQIDVAYTDQHGRRQSHRVFKSVSGFSSSISGLDGRSLGNPGAKQ